MPTVRAAPPYRDRVGISRGSRAVVGVSLVAALVGGAFAGAVVGSRHVARHAPPSQVSLKPASAVPAALSRAAVSAVGRTTTPPGKGMPFGKGPIYPGHTLVAYYGTAGTGTLGVLGQDTPDRVTKRLRTAAAPFARKGAPVQIVYELIATVADGIPGPDHDYSHDIATGSVREYIQAAHRNKAFLVLDLQPGRTDFLTVARRWRWALRDPWVGLAIDPEWRMGSHQVPARVVGSVRAREVNAVSGWLDDLAAHDHLPPKLFMVHQFRTTMVEHIERVVPRKRLVMIQHVDGFGSPRQKLATYHAVARPRQFHMGFKLFYDQDVHRMSAARVKQIRPRVQFVSFQ
jgi:hypothetical protein